MQMVEEEVNNFDIMGLSARDMEIRGVGNILGKEQSGNVNSIGLNLFMKFLKNAVDKKRNFKEVDEIELPVFELDENMGIPESFIPDIEARLQIYQEMSLVYQISNLEDLKEIYEDRFGELPEPFLNLFKYQQIKILAYNLKRQKVFFVWDLLILIPIKTTITSLK